MLLHIVARGKIGRSPESDLVDRYLKRIAWPTKLTELPDRGGKLPEPAAGTAIVVLDERGEALSSMQLARQLEAWRDGGKRGAVVVDNVDHPLKRLHRKAAGEPRGAGGGQHVVGAGEVVAQADRRPRPDEDRAGVSHPGGGFRGVGGDDLEVLGRPLVDDPQAVVNGIDEHVGRLPGERLAHPLDVLGLRDSRVEFGVDLLEQRLGVGDEQAAGEFVVLGLAEQQNDGVVTPGTFVRANQSEIAQLASTSRETVSRFLASCQRNDLLTTFRGRLQLRDPDGMRMPMRSPRLMPCAAIHDAPSSTASRSSA